MNSRKNRLARVEKDPELSDTSKASLASEWGFQRHSDCTVPNVDSEFAGVRKHVIACEMTGNGS